jgi:phosphotransferase system enzyme I (PtsI)
MNPFLGYRAVRLCLDKKDIFKTQLRALLRAAKFGDLEVNVPMVATIEEVIETKKVIEECKKELTKEKIPFGDFKLGIMVEIPSTADIADIFAKHVDFFSIGTNDLIQYTFAADRMSEKVSYLYQPYHPAILRKIKKCIDASNDEKIFTAVCGEVAGDLYSTPLLVGAGLHEFSMSPTSMLKVKRLITQLNKKECEELFEKAVMLETNDQVLKSVKEFLKKKNIKI